MKTRTRPKSSLGTLLFSRLLVILGPSSFFFANIAVTAAVTFDTSTLWRAAAREFANLKSQVVISRLGGAHRLLRLRAWRRNHSTESLNGRKMKDGAPWGTISELSCSLVTLPHRQLSAAATAASIPLEFRT